MKTNHFKILFFAFSLLFVLFSCEKDFFQEEETSTHQSRPENSSDVVSVEDAKEVAISFLNLNKDESKIDITKNDIKEVQTIVNDEETPIMYAVNFNNDSGFVVTSASFLERPILAYGENGNFDFQTIDDYNGVVDWAYTTYLIINDRIEKGVEPTEEVMEQWQSFGFQSKHIFSNEGGGSNPYPTNSWYQTITKGSLLTTNWNQKLKDSPPIGYNNYVRFNNCTQGKSPAGCVAVAMGQIMKYHNHPNIYSMNTMPNAVNSNNFATIEAFLIALFLQDIGTKVGMNYNCSSSGASSQNARNTFVFNYSYDASDLVNTNYNLIKQNIDNYRPVYLDGYKNREIKTTPIKLGIFHWTIGKTTYTYSNGHAWVADGYKEITKFTKYSNSTTKHIKIADLVRCNWGWGGFKNDWYHYGSLNNDQNQNDTIVNYIYKQRMIHNIKPKNS